MTKTAGLLSMGRRAGAALLKSRLGRGTVRSGQQMAASVQAPKSRIGKRVLTRAGIGAGVGAGGSMIKDTAQGKDISLTRAVGAGFAGGALGGALGTTAGKRMLRRSVSPRSTPNMSLRQSVKSLGTTKGVRSAVRNMAPLEKGFIGMSAYDTAKQLSDPATKGTRGGTVGSAVGETGGLLAASQWKGMRRVGRGGSLGAMARTLGLLGGASAAGSMIGSKFNSQKPQPKEAPYG